MKRLLLLFILLSPLISRSQTRGKDAVEADKATIAINLQSITSLMGKMPCTKAAYIHTTHTVTDSGAYITTVVFFPVLSALDSAGIDSIATLPSSGAMVINTKDIAAGKTAIITTIPPLPIVKEDNVLPIPLSGFIIISTQDITAANVPTRAIIPPLPFVKDDMTTVFPLGAVKMNTEDMPTGKVGTVTTIPPLPFVMADDVAILALVTAVTIQIHDMVPGKAPIAANLPPLPFVAVEIGAIPPVALITVNTAITPLAKVDLITDIPPLPVVRADEVASLSLVSPVAIKTDIIPAGKLEIITDIPEATEKRMPVEGMHLSPDGYSLLQKLEGFSPELYTLNDGGFTIGFGFFVPYGELAKWNKGISWEDAERMMQQKVPAYEDQVKQFINVPLTQNEFDALTMLAYNLGGFSKATSIVNDINNLEDFDKLQADWKRFVHSKAPNVSKGLMNRRKDELDVRKISNYQPEREIKVFKSRKS